MQGELAAAEPESVLAVPVALGPVELANRLVIAPHTVNFGFVDGSPDDDYIAYMTRRAPGFGLTWVPIAAPDPLGRAEPAQPWLWDDRFIPGLARLVDALRACGTEPGLQINHAGRQTSPMLIDGETPVAPSPEPPRSIYTTVPRELTVVEISGIVEGYAAAARRRGRRLPAARPPLRSRLSRPPVPLLRLESPVRRVRGVAREPPAPRSRDRRCRSCRGWQGRRRRREAQRLRLRPRRNRDR